MSAESEIKIRASIDAALARSGAGETVDAVNQVRDSVQGVGAAAKDTGEKNKEAGEKLDASVLGNIRSVHHLLSGFVEMGQGGTAAIGGVAAEGRVATEVFEGMLGPLAPILLIMSTITMLAVPMIEKWQEQQDKIEGAKDDTDDLKDAVDQLKVALDQVFDSQEQIEESDKNQLAVMKDKEAIALNLIKIQKEAATNAARAEYLSDLTQATTDQERKRLKEKFVATKADIEDDSEIATSQKTFDFKKEDLDQAQKTWIDLVAGVKGFQALVENQQDAAAAGKKFLEDNQLFVDKDGTTIRQKQSHTYFDAGGRQRTEDDPAINFIEEQQKKIDDLKKAKKDTLEDTPDPDLLLNDEQTARWLEDAKKRAEAMQVEIDNAQATMDQAIKAAAAVKTAEPGSDASKDLQKKIQDKQKEIDRQQEVIDNLKAEIPLAEAAVKNATDTAALNKNERAQETNLTSQKDVRGTAREDRDNKLDAWRASVEAELAKAGPDASEALKTWATNQLAYATVESLKNKLTDHDADKGADPTFTAKIQAEIEKALAEAGLKINTSVKRETDKENTAIDRDANKDLVGLTAQATAAVKASGHPELEGELKNLIEATKNNPVGRILGLIQILAQTTAAMHGAYNSQIDDLQKQLTDLKAKVDRRTSP